MIYLHEIKKADSLLEVCLPLELCGSMESVVVYISFTRSSMSNVGNVNLTIKSKDIVFCLFHRRRHVE